eukprot:m.107152 g.107152  ORF g.107152 m.107152 type:complete len:175 (-) comp51696_c0_seq2:70-594(-)
MGAKHSAPQPPVATPDDLDALCHAVWSNELADCQQIVTKCGKNIITTPFAGNAKFQIPTGFFTTPLHWAVFRGRSEILEWFLHQRVDCDVLSSDGRTPLMVASLTGSLTCVHLLLQAGANPAFKGEVSIDFTPPLLGLFVVPGFHVHQTSVLHSILFPRCSISANWLVERKDSH